MRLNYSILLFIALTCTGCFSKESQTGAISGENTITSTPSSSIAPDATWSVPEDLKDLRFSVIQHTGDVTDWRITMKDFANGFKKWAHPNSKFSWERDGNDSWILRMRRTDKASQTETTLFLVFTKKGNKAVLSRCIMNGEEYFQQYVATVTNDLVFNVLKTIGKLDESQRLPASE